MAFWSSSKSPMPQQGAAGNCTIPYQEVVDSLSEELKRYLAFYEDGHLKVSKTHRFHPLVTGFTARLERLKIPFQIQYVDLQEISKTSREKEAIGSGRDASDMQRAAKTLFEKAVHLRTSDIHIRCSSVENTAILFRVDGDLELVEEHPFEFGKQLCTTIYQSMTNVSDPTFEPLSRQDARISDRAHLPNGLDGVRVATSPQVDGYIMVLRMLYNDTTSDFDLGKLGYLPQQIELIEEMKTRPTGINVIGGPTGSGKSTTLQRTLGAIILESEGKSHIITVEDPPEYPIPGAVQTPVANAETPEERSRAFQAAIKAAMRLDPDKIMIGEMRDTPSSRLAIEASMTGHQVWTTLHANNAFAIIDRLVDLGIPMGNLTDTTILTGLICQRLIKTVCPHCREQLAKVRNRYSDRNIARIGKVVDLNRVFVTGPGCDHCRGTGTKGRTVVAEVVLTTPLLMEMIADGQKSAAKAYWKRELKGVTMLDHAILKVNSGLVDPFETEGIVGPLDFEFELNRVKKEAVHAVA